MLCKLALLLSRLFASTLAMLKLPLACAFIRVIHIVPKESRLHFKAMVFIPDLSQLCPRLPGWATLPGKIGFYIACFW